MDGFDVVGSPGVGFCDTAVEVLDFAEAVICVAGFPRALPQRQSLRLLAMSRTMRRPMQLQLLLPMLSIIVLAIVMASAASAYLTVSYASRGQAEQLNRVVRTLADAGFPLSRRVLEQMSALSGGEFVLVDENRRVLYSTMALGEEDLGALQRMREEGGLESFSKATETMLSGGTYLTDLVPVVGRGRAAGSEWLVVLYPKDRWWALARRVSYPILCAGLVAVLFAIVVSTFLAGRLVQPIKALGRQAEAIAAGRFQPMQIPPRNDEISDLALSINKMTEKLGRFESEVRYSERLRTLGQLGAGMAHQLRNSATGARMAIELHQRQCRGAHDKESLGMALQQLALMDSYLQRFLHLGRTASAPPQRIQLQSVVEDALRLVRPAFDHAKIQWSFRKPAHRIVVEGEPESLRELLVNLLLNAMEGAGRESGMAPRVVVELEMAGTDRAALRVHDSGPGPDPATGERMFEPFVTEKPEGTGLGLYVARQIAEAHRGSIRWGRREDMTCFTVDLPACEPFLSRCP